MWGKKILSIPTNTKTGFGRFLYLSGILDAMKQFYGPKNELMLQTSFDMDRCIIFLPGISGGAHGARFLPVDKLAEEDGYACARIALWEGEEDVKEMSYEDIFLKLDELLAELTKLDFLDFMLVGKSFGGGVALAYEHELISRKVLWAPAIGVGEGAGNWEESLNAIFSSTAPSPFKKKGMK